SSSTRSTATGRAGSGWSRPPVRSRRLEFWPLDGRLRIGSADHPGGPYETPETPVRGRFRAGARRVRRGCRNPCRAQRRTGRRQFGLSTLQYFTADAFEPVPALVAKFGTAAFSTRVMMRYQISGLDPRPVQTDLGYTFVQLAGAWVLVDDTGTDEFLTEAGHR